MMLEVDEDYKVKGEGIWFRVINTDSYPVGADHLQTTIFLMQQLMLKQKSSRCYQEKVMMIVSASDTDSIAMKIAFETRQQNQIQNPLKSKPIIDLKPHAPKIT